MPTYAFSAPIIAGKLQTAQQMISLTLGDRRSEAEALRRTAGLDREQVYVQSTPMGDYAVVVWDTSDIKKVRNTFATDTSEYAVWFRAQLEEIHGFNVAEMAAGPVPEIVGEWKSSEWSYDKYQGTALCFPIASGKTDVAREFIAALMPGGSYADDYTRTRGECGIYFQSFHVMSTPEGDVAVMYGEGVDGWFDTVYGLNATSSDAFYAWFRDGVNSFAGVTMFANATPPSIKQVLHLSVNVPAHA